MKKVYKLNNLGCASCANTMSDKIAKLDGVKKAKVNFMLSKLTVEVDDESKMPSKQDLEKIIKSVENYCEIV
ncbi:MAG: heavy-metal-associated domain-containing protein [Tissierellia bacterium]|nr:heavy-metal-associated domain-containing protein [Tissierellia bacterium]